LSEHIVLWSILMITYWAKT